MLIKEERVKRGRRRRREVERECSGESETSKPAKRSCRQRNLFAVIKKTTKKNNNNNNKREEYLVVVTSTKLKQKGSSCLTKKNTA